MTSQGDLQLETLDMESYLSRLASSAPTPGGGAVAGLTGAQAAALLSMVCNLSRGERFAEVRDLVDDINETCETARYRLMILANDDARVFAGVMSAYALKKSSEAEKSDRAIAIQLALAAAAEVPMKVMKETSLLLPLADSLADIGNSNLISDIGVAVHLIDATLYSARLNILINTRHLKDMALVKGFDDSIAQILENLELLKPRVLDKVNKGLQEK
jgi:formiminotetrahydrofolate cyclodeaminase